MKKFLYFLTAMTLLLFLAACNSNSAQDEKGTEWGYEGETAAVNWGSLDDAYLACSAGLEQSPINIPADAFVNDANLEFAYGESILDIQNNGHTIQVNYDEGSSVMIDGEAYNLLQFHFHAASENTLAGVQTPLEVHFVHANESGGLAVIGVMVEEGSANEAYAEIFDNMPEDAGASWEFDRIVLNAMDLMPSEKTYHRFDGSLTTPPCSEGVKWHVLNNTIEMSAEQIGQFTTIYNNNFRPIQAMNARDFIAVQEMAASEEKVEWGYEGETAAVNWGTLSNKYAACSAGMEQSPINIPAGAPTNPANLMFDYNESALNIFNNGHTIQANYDAGSSVLIDGQVYDLLQFHLHAASENTFEGIQTPLEIHFVHANTDGGLAVIGVMLEEGAENEAYAAFLNNMPAEKSDVMTVEGMMINALDMLPAEQTYYRFDGSLTTPPCSEGVKWHLMSETVELSADQIAQFTAIYNNNFRPVQAMNERDFIVLGDDAAAQDGGEAEKAAWGYEGEGAPANWGILDAKYAACSAGIEQSPINIPAGTVPNAATLEITYGESALNILNNGHTIQANYDAGSSVIIDGEVYDLLQFHLHAASENTFDGVQTPVEIHFVHANADGGLAVIGVMLEEGAENEAYAAFLDNMPFMKSDAMLVDGVTINAADMLPAVQTYYRFDGSLTTPPCSEGVKWHLMSETVELSADQIAQFTAIYNNNFRPVQAMNERDFIVIEQAEDAADSADAMAAVPAGSQEVIDWTGLSAEHAACNSGISQPIVDMKVITLNDLESISFNYGSSTVAIVNNEETFRVDYGKGEGLEIDGELFSLVQFQFLTPNEALDGGSIYPEEFFRMVHSDDDGNLALACVFDKQYQP